MAGFFGLNSSSSYKSCYPVNPRPSRMVRYAFQMLNWTECPEVERDPLRVSGAWVFRGTRVPVSALFLNLEDGARVEDFLEWFPGVQRKQVEAVLEYAARSLTQPEAA